MLEQPWLFHGSRCTDLSFTAANETKGKEHGFEPQLL